MFAINLFNHELSHSRCICCDSFNFGQMMIESDASGAVDHSSETC